jgi:hypothetical protein
LQETLARSCDLPPCFFHDDEAIVEDLADVGDARSWRGCLAASTRDAL